MRSQEIPTINRAHKANELINKDQWLLNSDGTTLFQQKRVAFLINGIVFSIHDVPDGTAQTMLTALKTELAKTNHVAAKAYSECDRNFTIDNIVSSSSDSASTQTKLVRLLEEETGNKVIDNKCAMHLGINLRVAQVKAAAKFNSTDVITDDHDGEEMQENALLSGHSTSESDDEDSSLTDSALLSYDIDSFVHELAKLFGHLGTPEYCHGSSTFRVFLEQKTKESSGDEKEYYLSVQKVGVCPEGGPGAPGW